MRDNVFWTFSAAAQTVAAFVAFLLAGYALVFAMMDAAARADETLEEIQVALKRKYHRWLSALVSATAAAVVASLTTVYLNDVPRYGFEWLQGMSALLTLVAVIGGVLFVIAIVDPDKYRKAAKTLTRKAEEGESRAATKSSQEFFSTFVTLEQKLRELWEQRTDRRRVPGRSGMPSALELTEVLRVSGVISGDLYDRLVRVIRYRNLVFHGQVSEVTSSELEALTEASRQLDQLLTRPGG